MHPKNNTDMTISELRNEIEILEIELSELKQELLQKKKAGGTHPADLQWYQDQITDIEYKLVSLELAIRKK